LLAADEPYQALDWLVGVSKRARQIGAPKVIVVSLQQAMTEAIVGRRLRASEQPLRCFAFHTAGGAQIGQYVVMHHRPEPQIPRIAQLIGSSGFAMKADMVEVSTRAGHAQTCGEIPVLEIAVTPIERPCVDCRLPPYHEAGKPEQIAKHDGWKEITEFDYLWWSVDTI
jgi:hypothetical protein